MMQRVDWRARAVRAGDVFGIVVYWLRVFVDDVHRKCQATCAKICAVRQ